MRNVFVGFAAMIAGCNNAPATPAFAQDDNLDIEVMSLKEQVKLLRERVDEAHTSATQDDWANLRTNQTGYAVVDAKGIQLLISLEHVSESASGSKATLRIGNPSTADITRLHLNLSYGKATKDGLLTEPVRNKQENITDRLAAGQWTEVTVGLPDTPPKDLGVIRINGAVAETILLRMAGV